MQTARAARGQRCVTAVRTRTVALQIDPELDFGSPPFFKNVR